MKRTGIAELPLHGGKAPRWLFQRMKLLAREIAIAIVTEYSPEEFLRRLSDPIWFQAFGCVLGFDWHSSGLTTTVGGALKEGLRGLEKDLGIFVAGGKGGTSRKTPQEIEDSAGAISVDPAGLIYDSRMAAKVDSAAVQDGYQLYHHNFIYTKSGLWCVVQQGMNETTRLARRYHWLSEDVKDFVCEPHKAICCNERHRLLNMVAQESEQARAKSTILSHEQPERLVKELEKIKHLKLPERHQLFINELNPYRLEKLLLKTYETKPENFERLLGTRGVGPKTIRALSLLSELIYGAAPSFKDPARYSFAHGGKDGYPYFVSKKEYDKSIEILRGALKQAKLGRSERIAAFKRLSKV